jgi:hypothetical protein
MFLSLLHVVGVKRDTLYHIAQFVPCPRVSSGNNDRSRKNPEEIASSALISAEMAYQSSFNEYLN